MKNFCIGFLCICVGIASLLFALNGRFEITTSTGEGSGFIWYKYDRLLGRTWVFTPQEDNMQWVEIPDFGYAYLPPEDQE